VLKKGGSRPSLALSKERVGFADRAVEGGIPKESAKPYFLPQISRRGGVKNAENKAENFKAIWWIGTTGGLFREVGSH